MPFGTLALVGLTAACYALARRVSLRWRHPLLHPIFLSGGMIILVLSLCQLSYDAYRPAHELITWPLGPVTVALAVPVYNQRARLRALLIPFVCGVVLGSLATIATVLALAMLGRLDQVILHSLAFKSVTAAIAVELARLYRGDPSLTAVFVSLTGMLGAIVGPAVLTWCRVTDAAARGIALGTISHALGTAAALQESETTGALSSLAMMGAAIATTLIAPVYVPLLLWALGQ